MRVSTHRPAATEKGGEKWPSRIRGDGDATNQRRPRAVLDEAHVGDIQGAFGTIRQHDTGARRSWGAPAAHAARDHGSRADRHGRGQRRRRRLDLRAGRTELRAQPAVDPAAADSCPDRQPGDGRAPRSGDRCRTRAADQRALRQVLGMVLGRRPVHLELPHDRDRVHRGEPGARLLRGEPLHIGARSPRPCSWS